jgi:uncharacterized protein YceK
MKCMSIALLAIALAVLPSACGTVCNLASGNPDNYGGVQRDLQFGSDTTAKGGLLASATAAGGTGDAGGRVALLALYGMDVSLSFIADTVTLPLAAYLRRNLEAATDG